MLIFSQYVKGLTSGVQQQLLTQESTIDANAKTQRYLHDELEKDMTKTLEDIADKTEGRLGHLNTQIDTFLTLIFTIVAILFAGLRVRMHRRWGDDGCKEACCLMRCRHFVRGS